MDKLKNIVEWTKLKIRIHSKENVKIYFHNREIWWVSLGSNIGHEQDGKNENFERPALIMKKFNKNMLWVLSLTSKEKDNPYFHSFEINNQKYTVILSQLRLISSKRLIRKINKVPVDKFEIITRKIKNFL